jgi:hypothetical protein
MECIVPSDHLQHRTWRATFETESIAETRTDGSVGTRSCRVGVRRRGLAVSSLHDRRIVECGKLTNRERRPAGLGR